MYVKVLSVEIVAISWTFAIAVASVSVVVATQNYLAKRVKSLVAEIVLSNLVSTVAIAKNGYVKGVLLGFLAKSATRPRVLNAS